MFFDLVKIRQQIEDATTLAVRAANGTTSSALSNSLNASNGLLHGGSAAALGLGIAGGGANAKLSRERKHRMREHATQKLSHAYHLDEIAASVATMQSASALEEVAKHVLQRNQHDADAKYVHFFHEKIPSRALAECTSLRPLDEIITQQPTEGAPYRTRAVTRIFKEDSFGAAKDLTQGLAVCRLYNSQLSKSEKPTPAGEPVLPPVSSRTDNKLEEQDEPSSLEPQLLFHRAGVYLTIACDYIDTALNGLRETRLRNERAEAEAQPAAVHLGHDAQKLVRTYAKRALRDYVSFLSYFEYSPNMSRDMTEDYFRNVNIIANGLSRNKSNDRRLLDFSSKNGSPDAILRTDGSSPEAPSSHPGTPSVHVLSSLFSAVPPTDLPPYPSDALALIPISKEPTSLDSTPSPFHESVSYHPLLTDALHSLLLCHILVQTSSKEHLRHAHMVARIARVCDGYPIFLAARSPARADWMEVLRRADNWLGLRASWEALCQPAPLPGQTSDEEKVHGGSQGDMTAEERRRHEAIMGALADDRVRTDEAFRASVRARELRAARDEEEEQRREYLRSAKHLPQPNHGQGNASDERGNPHDSPKRWAEEDGKEYPISTERAEALARWIKEAPPPGEMDGAGRKNRGRRKGARKKFNGNGSPLEVQVATLAVN